MSRRLLLFGRWARVSVPFSGLYDKICFGWDFSYGIDPALSAQPDWYDPNRNIDTFLKPGQIGYYYFDGCSFAMEVYFMAKVPQR